MLSRFVKGAMTIAVAATLTAAAAPAVDAGNRKAETATLANGMEVVVVSDRRAPVVTHMVWYRIGAADEPAGSSGIAHFFEHLMFKGTKELEPGEFSKIIARQGGQDNAFTSQDVTAYFQRIAKDRLPLVMKMEADRMQNLQLSQEDVLTERDVILEERRSRVDNNPSSILGEEMMAALYRGHPYGDPVIGWEHEISALDIDDALSFYKSYYAPNNAILVVVGDVSLDEVVREAEATYGKVPAVEDRVRDPRPAEPPHRAARRVELIDKRVGQPLVRRAYLAPSYTTAEPGEAEAIDLLMRVVGGTSTSRMYRALVKREKIAANAGGYFMSTGIDSGRIAISAVANPDVTLDRVEAAIDEVIADVVANGVTADELDRAKRAYRADYIYGDDSGSNVARRYGWGLASGQTIADIEAWPDRIAAITVDEVNAVAKTVFDLRKSVTGYLMRDASEAKQAANAGETMPAAEATSDAG